jgi:hypothetical protein
MVAEVASVVAQATTTGPVRRVYEPAATGVLRLADSTGATVCTGRCASPAVSVTVAAETACLELSSGRLCGILADAAEGLAEVSKGAGAATASALQAACATTLVTVAVGTSPT